MAVQVCAAAKLSARGWSLCLVSQPQAPPFRSVPNLSLSLLCFAPLHLCLLPRLVASASFLLLVARVRSSVTAPASSISGCVFQGDIPAPSNTVVVLSVLGWREEVYSQSAARWHHAGAEHTWTIDHHVSISISPSLFSCRRLQCFRERQSREISVSG